MPPDGIDVPRWVCGDPPLRTVIIGTTTAGLDLTKDVFQTHSADVMGRAVLHEELRRDQVLAFFSQLQPCAVAMEAYGGAYFGAAIDSLGYSTDGFGTAEGLYDAFAVVFRLGVAFVPGGTAVDR